MLRRAATSRARYSTSASGPNRTRAPLGRVSSSGVVVGPGAPGSPVPAAGAQAARLRRSAGSDAGRTTIVQGAQAQPLAPGEFTLRQPAGLVLRGDPQPLRLLDSLRHPSRDDRNRSTRQCPAARRPPDGYCFVTVLPRSIHLTE